MFVSFCERFVNSSSPNDCSLNCVNQSGPSHHILQFCSVLRLSPRKIKSAGLSSLLTCRQYFTGRVDCISAVRFDTKCFLSRRIARYPNQRDRRVAPSEYVFKFKFKCFLYVFFTNLISVTAPHNSSLGSVIVLFFIGATRDLKHSRAELILFSSSAVTR